MMKLAGPAALRLLLAMLIAVGFGWLVSEFSYQSINSLDRDQPERFELIIPPGTSEQVAAGKSVPSLPSNISFIVGDELVVVNEDSVAHQLGPIWVPPGSSGSLTLENTNTYGLECSFQPTQYMGIDVQPRPTAWIRFQGIMAVALPSGVLLWLYSLLAIPLKEKSKPAEEAAT